MRIHEYCDYLPTFTSDFCTPFSGVLKRHITPVNYKLYYTYITYTQNIQVQLKGVACDFLSESRRNHIQPSQPLITQQSNHLSSINLSFKEAFPWLLKTQRNRKSSGCLKTAGSLEITSPNSQDLYSWKGTQGL